MSSKEIKKIPMFRVAFKIGAGWILGKRVAALLCDMFSVMIIQLRDYFEEHREDNTNFGAVCDEALNFGGFKRKNQTDESRHMGFEYKK